MLGILTSKTEFSGYQMADNPYVYSIKWILYFLSCYCTNSTFTYTLQILEYDPVFWKLVANRFEGFLVS